MEYNTREEYLGELARRMEPMLEEATQGATMPKYRVSCGLPSRGAFSIRNQTIGQCFPPSRSNDETTEIFISPVLSDPVKVAETLVHEMIHAVVGCEHKHGSLFKMVLGAVGLEGRATSTHAGEELMQLLQQIVSDMGEYPHAELIGQEKRGRRLPPTIKIICPVCGWHARAKVSIVEMGLPTCSCGEKIIPAKLFC